MPNHRGGRRQRRTAQRSENRVTIRLSDAELAELDRLADLAGINRSDVIRRRLMGTQLPRPVPARRVHRAKPAILVLPAAALAVPQESTKLDECAQTAPRADTIRVRGAHHHLPAERAVLESTITKSDLSHALPAGKVGTLRAASRRARNVPSASTTLTLEALHRLPAGAAPRASMPAAQA